MIYQSIEELVGGTPILQLNRIAAAHAPGALLFAKLEYFNPASSVKDRVAKSLIADAEQRGLLCPGGTIIEPTSGNTGIGLAAIGAAKGYRVILTLPDTMSVERCRLLAAYGAELVLTEGAQGMPGAIAKAQALAAEMPGSYLPGQFSNPANPAAHRSGTGPEIWQQMQGSIDAFVATVGTGGTITGTGSYLKEQSPALFIAAVEPAGSPVLSGGKPGKHGLQGIGAGFVPEVLDTRVYDEILPITDADAYAMGREMAQKEGILVGISSGAALFAAVQLAKRPQFAGKRILALLPDTGEHYLSTPLFEA